MRIIVCLAMLICISSLALVIVKHYNRMAFVEFETLQHERDSLEIEWSRLQVESSTLQMPGYIEQSVAAFNMVYPREQVLIRLP